jgi:hypothetical protein
MSWKAVFQPRFCVAAGILLVAAVGLQGLISTMKLVLIKKPVELARPLHEMSRQFGPYVLAHQEPRLPSEIEDELGTKRYISWIFEDTRREEGEPGRYVRLHIPYYTGTIDTVPHVADRCLAAAGMSLVESETRMAALDSPRLFPKESGSLVGLTSSGERVTVPGDRVPITVSRFRSPRGEQEFAVSYFFIANGGYAPGPYQVRMLAFDPRGQYAYYAKVEVALGQMLTDNAGRVGWRNDMSDVDEVTERTGEFLSYAMPEIMRCLPDLERLEEQPEPGSPELAAAPAPTDR